MADENNLYYDGEKNESVYPLCEFKLTTTPNDFNILTIISFVKSKVFKIPDFQRHYVWDIKRASKLIESLLIGLPIPQVFLYERERNEFLVIDGQQRLMTLYYFFNGRFPKKEQRSALREIFDANGYIPEEIMEDDNYFQKFNLKLDGVTEGQDNKFNGKNYDTLGDYQMSLNLATIRNMIIKPVSNDDEDGAMFEIFNRLNSGGVNLTAQEIRMSLYQSPYLVSITKLNKNNKWRELLGKPIEDLRLSDVEAILRSLAMLQYSHNYKNTVAGFLNSFANHVKNNDANDIAFTVDLWNAFMDACSTLTESDFFTGAQRLSITLFESVFYAACISSFQQKVILVPNITKSYIDKLKSDTMFISYSTGKTTRKDNVEGRLLTAKRILESM